MAGSLGSSNNTPRFLRSIGRFFKRIGVSVRAFLRRIGFVSRNGGLTKKGFITTICAVAAVAVAVVLIVVLTGSAKQAAAAAEAEEAARVAQQQQQEALALREVAAPTPVPTPTPTPDPTLQYGMEDVRVSELQERLVELEYLQIDETTLYYGYATKSAVALFQRQHGLQEDGIAGPSTLEAIFADGAQHYNITEGTCGDDVLAMQEQLVSLGFLEDGKPDSEFGPKTLTAVKAFQDTNGLTADGIVAGTTLELLYSPEAKENPATAKKKRTRARVITVLELAASKLGCKYVSGATGPNSFDCSGLVYYCLKNAGSNRTRYTADGYSKVTEWDKQSDIDNLEKGDLMFFNTSGASRVGHVGIYVGSGFMIDASSSNGKVVKRDCRTSYWRRVFKFARRPW